MGDADLWSRWPAAWPTLGTRAELKRQPEDFRVAERANPEPDPAGEHLYLLLEKRNLTTNGVAAALARELGVSSGTIGYAGMKDKRAVTRQWFSVPAVAAETLDLARVLEDMGAAEDVQLHECARLRGRRKLRRGMHDGNDFEIRLRALQGAEQPALEARLAQIAEGVPNYFGRQRFGTDNVSRAIAWLPRRRRERDAFRRGLHLSVLRSMLFNEVLAARVEAGTWALADATGPLWGRGRPQPDAGEADRESAALAPHAEILEALEHAGLGQERRSLRLQPEALRWSFDGDDLVVAFGLPPGGYATSVLRELLDADEAV